jgi:hypothetical protein
MIPNRGSARLVGTVVVGPPDTVVAKDQYLVAEVRVMSFRPLRVPQGKLREKFSLLLSKISQSLRSFEMTRLFIQLRTRITSQKSLQ